MGQIGSVNSKGSAVAIERKPMLDLLLHKWILLTKSASIEAVYHRIKHEKTINKQARQKMKAVVAYKPMRQITKIKQVIVSMYPEIKFILLDYDTEISLAPDAYQECYINHQMILIDKIVKLCLCGKASKQ